VFEGGIRVPMAMRWKGVLPVGTVYDKPVISLDVFPTTMTLAGARPPEKKLDGVDLMPFLRGQNAGRPHEVLFWRSGGGAAFAVRDGDFKVAEPPGGQSMLFNLSSDVAEAADLAPSQPQRVERLEKLKADWNSGLVAPVFPGPENRGKKKKK
jgi:arylsulfatase A-like enzyme